MRGDLSMRELAWRYKLKSADQVVPDMADAKRLVEVRLKSGGGSQKCSWWYG